MMDKDFNSIMEKGLGRAIIILRSSANKDLFKESICYAMTHNLAYDVQSEGTRSNYIYDLICCFDDKDYFLDIACELFDKPISDSWLFLQISEILRNFAIDGSEKAKKIMKKKVDELIEILLNKKKQNKYIYEFEELEWLCVCINQYGSFREFLFIAEKLLEFTSKCKNENFQDFSYFVWECKNIFGKRLEKFLKSEKCIKYRSFFKNNEYEKVDFTKKEICNIEMPELLERKDYNGIQQRLRERNIKDKKIILQYIIDLNDENQLIEILNAIKPFKVFLPIKSLIKYTHLKNEQLSTIALDLLSKRRTKEVRELAIKQIKKENFDYFDMFVKNFKLEDSSLLEKIVKKLKINSGRYESNWHYIFMGAITVSEKFCVPKELLEYLYENELCSVCRKNIVKLMIKRNILTAEKLEECKFDCNMDIRKLVS